MFELLERDDEYVRAVFERDRRADAVLPAGQATECDELLFLAFDELGLSSSFEGMWHRAPGWDKETDRTTLRRQMYSSTLLGVIRLLGRYCGATSGPECSELVLRDMRWMTLLGLAPIEVQEGATSRSASLRN